MRAKRRSEAERRVEAASREVHCGPPRRRPKLEPDPVADQWIELTARIKHLAGMVGADLAPLARYLPAANPLSLREVRLARVVLLNWERILEEAVQNPDFPAGGAVVRPGAAE